MNASQDSAVSIRNRTGSSSRQLKCLEVFDEVRWDSGRRSYVVRRTPIVEFKVLKYFPVNPSRVPHINERRVLEIAVVAANQTVVAGVGAHAVGGAEILRR